MCFCTWPYQYQDFKTSSLPQSLCVMRNDGRTAKSPWVGTGKVLNQYWYCWMCCCPLSNSLQSNYTGNRHLSIFDQISELDREDATRNWLDFLTEGSNWPKGVEYRTLVFARWIQGFDPRTILVDSIGKKSSQTLARKDKVLQFAAEVLVRVGKKNN